MMDRTKNVECVCRNSNGDPHANSKHNDSNSSTAIAAPPNQIHLKNECEPKKINKYIYIQYNVSCVPMIQHTGAQTFSSERHMSDTVFFILDCVVVVVVQLKEKGTRP